MFYLVSLFKIQSKGHNIFDRGPLMLADPGSHVFVPDQIIWHPFLSYEMLNFIAGLQRHV